MLSVWSCFGDDWSIEDIPNPMKEPERCGRAGVQMSIICDVEDILSVDTKNDIEAKASTMWEVEFAVAIGRQFMLVFAQYLTLH